MMGMMHSGIFGAMLAGLLLAGCSGDPYRNLYQGMQMRNDMGKTPEERAAAPRQPSYDQYKQGRAQQDRR